MSTVDILNELPTLQAEERTAVFQRLCELQEDDLLRGVGPTDQEKKLLDDALAEFRRDANPGAPWREAPGASILPSAASVAATHHLSLKRA